MPDYGFGMDSIVSVHQLVSNAIVLDGQTIGASVEAGNENATNEN